jgi:hypothetical protein
MVETTFANVTVRAVDLQCTMPDRPIHTDRLGPGTGVGAMAHKNERDNERDRVVQEWLRLPESRRRHATDAVAFAYRLLREQPELFGGGNPDTSHENIVKWLSPYVNRMEIR